MFSNKSHIATNFRCVANTAYFYGPELLIPIESAEDLFVTTVRGS
jgi:hypothetical protein